MTGAQSEIAGLIDQQVRAWNAGDAAGFSEAVADDCVFTNIFGQLFVGRDAFERQHAQIFASVYKGSRVEMAVDHLRLIAPDVAAADISATLHAAASAFGPARTVRTKLLQVLVRQAGRWRIESFHNVEERPPPGSPANPQGA